MDEDRTKKERDNILFLLGELRGDNKSVVSAIASLSDRFTLMERRLSEQLDRTEARLEEKLNLVDLKHSENHRLHLSKSVEADTRIKSLENYRIKIAAWAVGAAGAGSAIAPEVIERLKGILGG